MLKLRWTSVIASSPAPVTEVRHRDELKIRDLLDDPCLRRACGLDPDSDVVPDVKPHPMPELRFDRRRLLENAAA
jgi:hypothetical protein